MEEVSKKNAELVAEEIDAAGQESETKAVKWVKEIEDKNQKKSKESDARDLQLLFDKRKYAKNPYYKALFDLAKKRINEYDLPQGYNVDCFLKEDGRLIFGLQKEGYRWYAKGMTICGNPTFDINCVDRMTVQLMLSLDELEKQHEKGITNSGIYLPPK